MGEFESKLETLTKKERILLYIIIILSLLFIFLNYINPPLHTMYKDTIIKNMELTSKIKENQILQKSANAHSSSSVYIKQLQEKLEKLDNEQIYHKDKLKFLHYNLTKLSKSLDSDIGWITFLDNFAKFASKNEIQIEKIKNIYHTQNMAQHIEKVISIEFQCTLEFEKLIDMIDYIEAQDLILSIDSLKVSSNGSNILQSTFVVAIWGLRYS